MYAQGGVQDFDEQMLHPPEGGFADVGLPSAGEQLPKVGLEKAPPKFETPEKTELPQKRAAEVLGGEGDNGSGKIQKSGKATGKGSGKGRQAKTSSKSTKNGKDSMHAEDTQ
eukprot:3315929-Alexandrium_andersonii.AAC.1